MDRVAFLTELQKHGVKNNIPNISLENACFLRGLLRERKVKHLLEIGSANGYSTIHFACELEEWGGKITSIDFSQLAFEDAQDNFEAAGVTDTVSSYF